MTDYKIVVEYQALNPVKPTGFGVFADKRAVAFLTIDQVREALRRFEELEAKRADSARASNE